MPLVTFSHPIRNYDNDLYRYNKYISVMVNGEHEFSIFGNVGRSATATSWWVDRVPGCVSRALRAEGDSLNLAQMKRAIKRAYVQRMAA